jgi:hypothetical protein
LCQTLARNCGAKGLPILPATSLATLHLPVRRVHELKAAGTGRVAAQTGPTTRHSLIRPAGIETTHLPLPKGSTRAI